MKMPSTQARRFKMKFCKLTLADMVREQIVEEVKTRGQFALIVDETKDVSKTERISFVLRYFYNESV